MSDIHNKCALVIKELPLIRNWAKIIC